DLNGFLPTHMSKYSAAPTGDLTHDTKVCRNGRILDDPATKRAKKNNAPYLISVSRQEGDGVNFLLTRAVFVPLYINGRRWGDYLVGYGES
ncbi:MAG: chemotaxis protein, partial [Pseudomonadota bacterium]